VSFVGLLLLAIGLAMDATAVSVARGLQIARVLPRHVISVALFFGGFQALMPLVGWQVGSQLGPLLRLWDHWVAFVLLAAIGGKMIWDAKAESGNLARPGADPFGLSTMLLLAIATSIDALAAGITLPMLDAPLWGSIATIGLVTAACSAAGLFAGRQFGQRLGARLDLFGGLLLIGLGVKVLLEHTFIG
jgi:putative Mn2+ efflux pump MntP